MLEGLRAWPVVAGVLVNVAGNAVFAFLYGVTRMGLAVAGGAAPGAFAMTTTDYALTLVFGLLCTLTGGYAAGRLAPTKPALHGLAMGLVLLVLNVMSVSRRPDVSAPAWFTSASAVGVVLVAWLGGRLAGTPGAASAGK